MQSARIRGKTVSRNSSFSKFAKLQSARKREKTVISSLRYLEYVRLQSARKREKTDYRNQSEQKGRDVAIRAHARKDSINIPNLHSSPSGCNPRASEKRQIINNRITTLNFGCNPRASEKRQMHYIAILRNGDVAISAQVREDSANIKRHTRHQKGSNPHTCVERRKMRVIQINFRPELQSRASERRQLRMGICVRKKLDIASTHVRKDRYFLLNKSNILARSCKTTYIY